MSPCSTSFDHGGRSPPRRGTTGRAACSLLALVLSAPAGAGVLGENVTAHVAFSALHDSNLLRSRSDGQSASRMRESGGLSASLELGRQSLDVVARAHNNRFDRFSELDYVGGWLDATFDWAVGSRLEGVLDYSYLRELTRFDDVRLIERDLTTLEDSGAQLGYYLTPRLQLRGGVRSRRWRHSSELWLRTELDEVQYEVSTLFRTRMGSFVGVGVIRIDGEYPHREVAAEAVAARRYEQVSPALILEWQAGQRTTLNARLGRTSRRQAELSERDFSAVTGSIAADYQLSPMMRVQMEYAREVRSIEEPQARAALVDRVMLSPIWLPSGRLSATGRAGFRRHKFVGISTLAFEGRRDEEIFIETVWTYGITPRLAVELGAGRGERTSSQPELEYTYWYGMLGLRATF